MNLYPYGMSVKVGNGGLVPCSPLDPEVAGMVLHDTVECMTLRYGEGMTMMMRIDKGVPEGALAPVWELPS